MAMQLQLLKEGSYSTLPTAIASFFHDTRQGGLIVSDIFNIPATSCITQTLLHHRQLVTGVLTNVSSSSVDMISALQ
jgi:hypothetical protein